jgi:hypothetical protein
MTKRATEVPTQEDLQKIKDGFEAFKKLQDYFKDIIPPTIPYRPWHEYQPYGYHQCSLCGKWYIGYHYCNWITYTDNKTISWDTITDTVSDIKITI